MINKREKIIERVQECFFDISDLQDWIKEGIAPSGYKTQSELLDDVKARLEEIEVRLSDCEVQS